MPLLVHDPIDLSCFSDRSPQMPDKIDTASLLPTASDLDTLRRDYGILNVQVRASTTKLVTY